MKRFRIIFTFIIVISVFVNFIFPVFADTKTAGIERTAEAITQQSSELAGYENYLNTYKSTANIANGKYTLDINAIKDSDKSIEITEDKTAKMTGTKGSLTLPAEILSDGLYQLNFSYMTFDQGVNPVSFCLYIDGKIPFKEASSMELRRLWKPSEKITSDLNGNDIMPDYAVLSEWQNFCAYDSEGITEDPFQFYLSKGSHTITFTFTDGSVELKDICFNTSKSLKSYSEYCEQNKSVAKYSGESITFEAENVSTISSMFLIPQNDMSSPYTSPSSIINTKLNTLGGSNWKTTGETASWNTSEIITETAMYRISMRYFQNKSNQGSVHRRLLINGEVPFAEANNIAVNYGDKWQSDYLGEYYIRLAPGDVVSLECVLGDSAESIEKISTLVNSLNVVYRKIIMVTGTSPDAYRDYNLEEQIPNIKESFESCVSELNEIVDIISQGKSKSQSQSGYSTVFSALRLLKELVNDVDSIAKSGRLSTLKSDISSLGSLIMALKEQPLTIDTITFSSEKGVIPKGAAGFIDDIKYKFNRFLASFSADYSKLGSSGSGKAIKVWVNTGRDQASIIKELIENEFTPETGINIQLELVVNSIIEANLAGKGPEVALMTPAADTINYAMRGALYNLSSFEDFISIKNDYISTSFLPFEYENSCYGVPETMSYLVMFYRKDILNSLGLSIPQTWNDIITTTLPILNRNNMEFGVGNIASNLTLYTNLLYQLGGKLYSDDFKKTALDSEEAYKAMIFGTKLYTDYNCPQAYDTVSRFRTGEMPIIIDSYALYNNISYTIPELKGQWGMAVIPGVQNSDGSIDNTQVVSESGSIMFKSVKDPEAAWKFIKWWNSKDVQLEFGIRQEAILGASGRYMPANLKVLSSLPWSNEQLETLLKQSESCIGINQIPGCYFLTRAINNAFMTTVLSGGNAREQLQIWNEQINMELERKRMEFNYSPTGDN